MEEEDLVDDCYAEIDEEYEFDASQFYDFTRLEIDSEIEEVERWFEISGDYPHSPFIVKLNLEKILSAKVVPNASTKQSNTNGRHGVFHSKKNAKGKGDPMLHDTAKPKQRTTDKLSQPNSWSFMEPTASHLAKQHKMHGKHSSHLCTRFQRISAKLDQKNSSFGSDNLATKRQKLEIGYLKKASHLKHQFPLLHKSSKKVTVPREPELETQLRAQMRRSKNNSVSSETENQKEKGCKFKAHPLNRKILQARSLPQPKKGKPQSPEFQEFHFKNIERINHHSSAKENRVSAGDKLLGNPLIEQFTELSLESNSKTNSAKMHSSAKASGKAMPDQCGGHMRVHEANMTSSMEIR